MVQTKPHPAVYWDYIYHILGIFAGKM